MNTLYKIEKLRQFYFDENGEKKSILEVEDLSIMENKFIVILGNSGSGKTTLLEILGAINKIDEGNIIYKPESENIPLNKLWQDEKAHSEFLKEKLAFTFQDANLLHYFNVEENIALPDIINKNYSIDKAMEKVHQEKILKNFGLESEKDKNIKVISGGEQQRVALARSYNSKFEVFFTDEPTGNVGIKHEAVIFQYLRNLVDNAGKSVIVVTHNMQKALEYADQLIIITQKDNMGLIKRENVLTLNRKLDSCLLTLNDQLLNIPVFSPLNNAMTIYNPTLMNIIKNRMGTSKVAQMIEYHFSKDESDITIQIREKDKQRSSIILDMIKSIIGKITYTAENIISLLSFGLIIPIIKKLYRGNDSNFSALFVSRDLKRYYRGKAFSFLIIFILSLFTISSYTAWNKILQKKLNNPFVNVLLVKNNSSKSLDKIQNSILKSDFKQKYYIKDITPTQSLSLKMAVKQAKDEYSYITGRTINDDDPLFVKLMDYKENKNSTVKTTDGIFITRTLLSKLGYSYNEHYIKVVIANKNLYLPIIGVYKFLPGDTFIVTNSYLQKLNSGALFYKEADFFTFVDVKPAHRDEIIKKFSNLLKKNNVTITSIKAENDKLTFKLYKNYSITFIDSIWQDFGKTYNIDNEKLYFPPNSDFIPAKTFISHFDWFFLHREKIAHSEELKQKLSELNLQIDIEKISTQKDFKTVTSLLKFAIIFMELITLISTLVFIKYSFYLHIFQLRKELGILKSLGINKLTLSKIFRFENVIFFLSISIFSFLFLAFLELINMGMMKFGIFPNIYLNILSINTLIHIAFVFIVSLIGLNFTIEKIVILPAGDLIYDRIGIKR